MSPDKDREEEKVPIKAATTVVAAAAGAKKKQPLVEEDDEDEEEYGEEDEYDEEDYGAEAEAKTTGAPKVTKIEGKEYPYMKSVVALLEKLKLKQP